MNNNINNNINVKIIIIIIIIITGAVHVDEAGLEERLGALETLLIPPPPPYLSTYWSNESYWSNGLKSASAHWKRF